MKIQHTSTIVAVRLVLACATNAYAQNPSPVQPSPTTPNIATRWCRVLSCPLAKS